MYSKKGLGKIYAYEYIVGVLQLPNADLIIIYERYVTANVLKTLCKVGQTKVKHLIIYVIFHFYSVLVILYEYAIKEDSRKRIHDAFVG